MACNEHQFVTGFRIGEILSEFPEQERDKGMSKGIDSIFTPQLQCFTLRQEMFIVFLFQFPKTL
jgi:hypothetical protein